MQKQEKRGQKQYDIIIAGSGPAGLIAGITAARENASVLILEQKPEPCKKLYATGNGRCNFTNLKMSPGVYRGGMSALAEELTDEFDRDDLLYFFHDLGLMTRHIGDYIYPYNEQAAAVAGVLLAECKRLGIEILCNAKVVDITRNNTRAVDITHNNTRASDITQDECGGFLVDIIHTEEPGKSGSRKKKQPASKEETLERIRSTKVILAVGGKASPTHGSDGNLNKVIRRLGHEIVPQQPALVPLLFADKRLSALAGVRVKCGVSLMVGKEPPISSEQGEIIFNKDNISGIPVMQLSRFAVCALAEGKRALLELNFFCEESEEETFALLKNAFHAWGDPYRTAVSALGFCLPAKLAEYVITTETKQKQASAFTDEHLRSLAQLLQHFPVEVTGNAGFNRAQVTAGGVAADQVTDRLESVCVPGLYFAGEILDVDGTCGGYNLHFAFASGRIAGRSAAEKL